MQQNFTKVPVVLYRLILLPKTCDNLEEKETERPLTGPSVMSFVFFIL